MLIYKVTNNINGKIYIGKTTRTLEKRKSGHLSNAKYNESYFHKALNKYGFDNFTWETIYNKITSEEDLNELEEFLISEYSVFNKDNLYNILKGGDSPPNRKGISLSEEHRKKISKSNTGKKVSPETRKKLSDSHKGYVVREETKVKLRENSKINSNFGMRGKNQSEEARKKISKIQTGKILSTEQKNKISASNKGKHNKKFTEEWKHNLSISHKGFIMPEETKKKLSISLSGRKRTEEHQRKLNESRKRNHEIKKEINKNNEYARKDR
jgi:group I intron endonuclease